MMESMSERDRYQSRVDMGIITAQTLLHQMAVLKEHEDSAKLASLISETVIIEPDVL